MGLPIPTIRKRGLSASAVVLEEWESIKTAFGNFAEALTELDTDLRLFGKPEVSGKRRMGVALARGDSIEQAKSKALTAASAVSVEL